MKLKLSQILKYVGYVIGGLAAIRLVYVAFSTILDSWVSLIVLGLGALSYFIGKFLKKQGK
jgi:hypothetical protein